MILIATGIHYVELTSRERVVPGQVLSLCYVACNAVFALGNKM